MDDIKRRARIGWIAGLIALVAIFAWASFGKPTIPDARAAAVSRGGLLTLVGFLPIVLAGRAISRFTNDNLTAAVVLPVVLAIGLGALMFMFGWLPEDARLCSAWERYGFAPDPECFTPMGVRLTQLAEAAMLWAVFGGVLYASFRLRERKSMRAAARA